MSEPITGGLRYAMERYCNFKDENRVQLSESEFENHCDAIDAIHANLERENESLRRELDRVLGELDDMQKTDGISDKSDSERFNALMDAREKGVNAVLKEPEGFGLVKLPKNADDVPIHVGDVMDGYGKTIEVVELRYGRSGWVLISRDGNGYADTFAFTHHHEPTVEDVLRGVVTLCHNTWKEGSAFEFYDVDDVMKSGNIADFAVKLRLAGDAE